MPEKFSPFTSIRYGWEYGEDGWNVGMDSNLKKTSYLLDGNFDGSVVNLPTTPVSGQAYWRTSDKTFHYGIEGAWEQLTLPKWYTLKLRGSGKNYIYTGSDLVEAGGGSSETLAILAESDGAGLIGFNSRTVENKLKESVSVLDFGADPTGAADSHAAFAAAYQSVRTKGGGKVYVPAGVYKIDSSLNFWPVDGGWHNFILEGDGFATVLDFSGQPANTDGIRVRGWAGRWTIRDLTIKGSKRHGLNINADITPGMPDWMSSFAVHGVRIESCLGDGIRAAQTYMGDFQDVECHDNKGHGFNLLGFHTSMNFNKCWSTQNTPLSNVGHGWQLNGLVYSCFNSCGSDAHNGNGWKISNIAGVTWNGCGSESNSAEGFYFETGTKTSGLPGECHGIRGAILDGCFSVSNGAGGAGIYAAHVAVSTTNNTPATISIRGNTVGRRSTADYANVFTSSSDAAFIDVIEEFNRYSGGVNYKSGAVTIQNMSVVGKSCLARISQAGGNHQNLTSPIETTANIGYIVSNTLRASLDSGGIKIPDGVNRVRVVAGAFFGDNSDGERAAKIFKNGAIFTGSPQPETKPTGFTGLSLVTAIVEVIPGDVFHLRVFQNSGVVVTLQDSPSTFISVEAVG